MSFGYFSKEFKLDASSDTLLLEKKLTDNLGLSVQIREGKGEKGEIKIKYSSYDQLNFIIDKLN